MSHGLVPEGDTIRRTAEALRARLVGKPLKEVRPERFRRLEGDTVSGVEANGKHLLIRFASGLVLHSHMRMAGSWYLYRPGEAWSRPQRLAKIVLTTADSVAVLFNAPVLELLREKEAGAELAHLGPDILAPELDLAGIIRRARASDRRTLGDLLLDQRVSAGIGNIYKCESLWRLKLDPWRPPAELNDAELGKLYEEARQLMRQGLKRHPPHAVHGRTGRPCPRCSGRVACKLQGEQPRFTYFCPTCQQAGLG